MNGFAVSQSLAVRCIQSHQTSICRPVHVLCSGGGYYLCIHIHRISNSLPDFSFKGFFVLNPLFFVRWGRGERGMVRSGRFGDSISTLRRFLLRSIDRAASVVCVCTSLLIGSLSSTISSAPHPPSATTSAVTADRFPLCSPSSRSVDPPVPLLLHCESASWVTLLVGLSLSLSLLEQPVN